MKNVNYEVPLKNYIISPFSRHFNCCQFTESSGVKFQLLLYGNISDPKLKKIT